MPKKKSPSPFGSYKRDPGGLLKAGALISEIHCIWRVTTVCTGLNGLQEYLWRGSPCTQFVFK